MSRTILYIFLYFVEAIIAYYYLHLSLKTQRDKKCTIPLYIVIYSALCLIFFLDIPSVNLLFFPLFNTLLIYSTYKTTFYVAIFHSLILTICMGLAEMLPASLLGGIFSQYANISVVPFAIAFPFLLTSKFLYFLCLTLILFVQRSLLRKKTYTNIGNVLICFSILFTLIILSAFLYICTNNRLSDTSQYYIATCAFLLFAQNILIVWINEYHQQQSNKIYLLELEKQQNLEAAKYHTRLMQQAEELKGLRHDIKNHLLNIQAKYESGHTEEANAYVDTLLNKDSLTHFFQPTTCDNLNLILARYCSLCQDHDIIFRANVQNSDVNFLSFEEITTIFCNLLDNAYEAAVACENPFIDLDITTSKSEHKTIITMINSCKAAPIPNPDSPFFLSSKDDSTYHGFGLRNVRRVVKTYNGQMDTYFSEEEQEFHTILFLNTPKEGKKNENSNL